MIGKFKKLPLEKQLVWSFFLLASFVIALTMTISVFVDIRSERRQIDNTIGNIAEYVASLDSVVDMLEKGYPDPDVQHQMDSLCDAMKNVNVLMICDRNKLRFYHTKRQDWGDSFVDGEEAGALAGQGVYITTGLGTNGEQRRAFCAIKNQNGETLGFVMTGILNSNLIKRSTSTVMLYLALLPAALLLAMMKKLYLYHDNQKAHAWKDEGMVTSLEDATVVVVGFGNIGRAFGRLCKLLGAHVIGIRRHKGAVPAEADEMGTLEDLPEVLPRADVVASVLPGTPATTHLYDAKLFAAMKPGAWFINCGRGNAVVQDDLRQALLDGHLAGAALDVTDPEPLPADSPLWDTPNLVITPHISGDHHLAKTWDNVVKIAATNLKHYLAGEPLENPVDRATGYKKSE